MSEHSKQSPESVVATYAKEIGFIIMAAVVSAIAFFALQKFFYSTPGYYSYMDALSSAISQLITLTGTEHTQANAYTMRFYDTIFTDTQSQIILDDSNSGLITMSFLVIAIICWGKRLLQKLAYIVFAVAVMFSTTVATQAAELLLDNYLPLYSIPLANWVLPIIHALVAAMLFIVWYRYVDRHRTDRT